jgi:hypothetical protein
MTEETRRRYARNQLLFMIIAPLVGITYSMGLDTIATYLYSDPATLGVAEGFGTYSGLGTLIAAFLILLLGKIGYKKIIIIAVASSALIPFTAINFTGDPRLLALIIVSLMTGITIFTVVVDPFVVAYSDSETINKTFARILFLFQAAYVVGAAIGGPAIVYRFSSRLGISYGAAQELTRDVANLGTNQLAAYLAAHRDIMLVVAISGVMQALLAIFMAVKQEDYITEKSERISLKGALNRKVVTWIVVMGVFFLAQGFIIPYTAMYMSEVGIARSTIGLISSANKLVTLVWLAIVPFLIKKLGKVNLFTVTVLACIPLLLLAFFGRGFGSIGITIVAISILMRSSFLNGVEPAQRAIGMVLVSKQFRPAFASMISLLNALVSVAAGLINQGVIFKLGGFGLSYVVSAVFYFIIVVTMYLTFGKKDVVLAAVSD